MEPATQSDSLVDTRDAGEVEPLNPFLRLNYTSLISRADTEITS